MKNRNEAYLSEVVEPVFVILLESDSARVRHVKKMLKTNIVNAEIVPAVDVGKITRDELKQFIDNGDVAGTYYDDLTPGELGCAMSHLSVWRKIAAGGFEQALVLEDDFMFCQNFSEKYDRLKKTLPKDFDVTFLYLWLRKRYPVKPSARSPHIGIPSDPYGTVGYIISRRGALNLCRLIPPVRGGIDGEINALFKKKKINVYAAMENIIGDYNGFPSTVRHASYSRHLFGDRPHK